ncbi:MAG: ECF transporter S component [Desulfurococcaceae archaeon]
MALTALKFAAIALFGALAIVLGLVPIGVPFPLLPRVSWDAIGIPATLATLLYGLDVGAPVQLLACIGILIRGNWIGSLFKGVAELSTIIPLHYLFKRVSKEKSSAKTWATTALAFAVPALVRATVMAFMNYYVLPPLIGMPEEAAKLLIAPLYAFNLTMALINIGVAYAAYLSVEKFWRMWE